MTPKAQETKRIDELDYLKIKNVCVLKDIINRVKMQPKQWEKIVANYVSDKELITRIYIKSCYNCKRKQWKNGQ